MDRGRMPLRPAERLDAEPAFQPIVDLHDAAIVGYEALMRGEAADESIHPSRVGRPADSLRALDLAARESAMRAAAASGLDHPLSLFLNVDPSTVDDAPPERPATRYMLLLEVTEAALVARPEAILRALTRLRTLGWGIALDDVGADSRSLALISMLYPDVIKLDLRLLAERSRDDRARIVTAVAAEAERRHASVLAHGIDTDTQLEHAKAIGATLGQGTLLGAPGALPSARPEHLRGLRLTGATGDTRVSPWRRVTNWRRPSAGSDVAVRAAVTSLVVRAAGIGETAIVLAVVLDDAFAAEASEALVWLAPQVGFVGVLTAGDALRRPGLRSGGLADGDELAGTAVMVVLSPDFSACFVARETGRHAWSFATTYDRDTVVECALPLMARMEPLA